NQPPQCYGAAGSLPHQRHLLLHPSQVASSPPLKSTAPSCVGPWAPLSPEDSPMVAQWVSGRGRPSHSISGVCVQPILARNHYSLVFIKQGQGGVHADGTSAKKPTTATSPPPYWQSKGFSSTRNVQPGHLPQGVSQATSKPLSSLPESQRTADEVRTPLGIPLSKLSQAKHLKTRAGGGQQLSTDSKRRLPGAASHKDQ
uniref:Uncharacterized protein n=1 Tax=Chelydra serpentina TaxID=8475 RepID=A0A8C3SLL1_CHESE